MFFTLKNVVRIVFLLYNPICTLPFCAICPMLRRARAAGIEACAKHPSVHSETSRRTDGHIHIKPECNQIGTTQTSAASPCTICSVQAAGKPHPGIHPRLQTLMVTGFSRERLYLPCVRIASHGLFSGFFARSAPWKADRTAPWCPRGSAGSHRPGAADRQTGTRRPSPPESR